MTTARDRWTALDPVAQDTVLTMGLAAFEGARGAWEERSVSDWTLRVRALEEQLTLTTAQLEAARATVAAQEAGLAGSVAAMRESKDAEIAKLLHRLAEESRSAETMRTRLRSGYEEELANARQSLTQETEALRAELKEARNGAAAASRGALHSGEKGRRGEEELADGLNRLFPTAHVEDKHATPTAGDFLLHVGRLRLMVETKSYTRNVQKGEIDKFYRDVDGPGTAEANCAVLLSMDSGICCKEDLSLEVRNGKPVMFVHNLRDSYDRLLLVVKVLDAIIGAAGSIDISHAETSEKLRDLVKSMKRSFTSQKTRLDKYCKAQLDSIAEQEARLIEVAVTVGLPGAGPRHQTGPRSAPSLVVKTEAAPLS